MKPKAFSQLRLLSLEFREFSKSTQRHLLSNSNSLSLSSCISKCLNTASVIVDSVNIAKPDSSSNLCLDNRNTLEGSNAKSKILLKPAKLDLNSSSAPRGACITTIESNLNFKPSKPSIYKRKTPVKKVKPSHKLKKCSPEKEITPEIMKIFNRIRQKRENKTPRKSVKKVLIVKDDKPKLREKPEDSDFSAIRLLFEGNSTKNPKESIDSTEEKYLGCKPKIKASISSKKLIGKSGEKSARKCPKKSEKLPLVSKKDQITNYFPQKISDKVQEIEHLPKYTENDDPEKRKFDVNNFVGEAQNYLILPTILPVDSKLPEKDEKTGEKRPKSPTLNPTLCPRKSPEKVQKIGL